MGPNRDPLDFSGCAVLVTGGTRGIGFAIAGGFAARGASVVVCGRNEPEKLGEGVRFVAADVREPDQVDELVQAVVDGEGRLDVVVNNAGGSPPADAATASPRFHDAIIRLNLLAPLHVAQRGNLLMQGQPDGGVILNVGSVSGMRPSPGTAAYGAAKAGLLNLTRSLAQEWAPKVRVNCVTAGPVLTDETEQHYGGDAGLAAMAGTIPLGRLCEPADVADACLFLASPLARFVTGANLVLDGGGDRPAFLTAVEGLDRGQD
ncbi:MAG: SDR family oxidoreductase [Actinobacteria bacterium]|nr:SDR family oxidoreductase [Actinomycetota bacterium]